MCKKSKFFAAVIVAMLFSQVTLAQSTLVSNQSSVVANSIKSEAQNCANGAAGTIGSSIGTAMQIHTEMASATPNVETLFDVANDCFSGVSNIFDLSFSIPSLSSILNAAKDAVMQYAQKKVCSAATQVTGMVTNPLNQAITNVNGYGSVDDLNGLSNNLVKSGMSQIDPNLGASYSGGGGNNYTVGTNPFNSQQTEFSNNNSNSNASQLIGNCSAQISTLNHDIFAQQQQLIGLTNQYDNAKAAADACHANPYSNSGNCYSVDMAAASLQNQLNAAQQSVATLQSNLANLSSSSACSAATSPSSLMLSPMSTSPTGNQTVPESESSWTNSILNIFN